jgi:hypothetical protein
MDTMLTGVGLSRVDLDDIDDQQPSSDLKYDECYSINFYNLILLLLCVMRGKNVRLAKDFFRQKNKKQKQKQKNKSCYVASTRRPTT